LTSCTTPRETADVLLDRGFFPVAIHPNEKRPIGNGWGEKQWPADRVARTFANYPQAGVGLCLGPGRAPGNGWLIDVEVDGPEGETSLATLHGGEVVETLGLSSARGPHLFLRADPERMQPILPRLKRFQVKEAGTHPGCFHLPQLPGLELRIGGYHADGTVKQLQSVVPPTVGTNGQARRWNGVETVAPPPEAFYAFLEAIAAEAEATTGATEESVWDTTVPGGDPDRVDRWLRSALARVCGEVAQAPAGKRHAILMKLVYTLAGYLHYRRGFTEAELEAAMIKAANQAAPERADDNPRCVRDAINGGKASPLELPPELHRIATAASAGGRAAGSGAADEDDSTPLPTRPWPDPADPAAYHGLVGEIVGTIEPESEADPQALLIQVLIGFGNAVGRSPRYLVESTYHRTNENAVLVGDTALGRKGTAADRMRTLLAKVDPVWAGRIIAGLSSGEGLIAAVGDPVYRLHDVRSKGRVIGQQRVVAEEGVEDKRLLPLETEFGSVFRVLEREGNRLSALIRQAWDDGMLASLTKTPRKATNAHISIIGHITAEELRVLLNEVDAANGFANRFLWLCVRRSKVLPHGGKSIDLESLAARLKEAVEHARKVEQMAMTPAARSLWEEQYERLTTPPRGVLGLITSRAAPHTIRLAMLYALLDRTAQITDDHLRAALALWSAAARSAAYIWGDRLADPKAELILKALRRATPRGMTRTEISVGVFNRNLPATRIAAALTLLVEARLVRETQDRSTGGRAACRYFAVSLDEDEKDERNEKSPPPGGEPRDGEGVNSSNSFNSSSSEEREVFET
jgi:hypothetical protein